MHNKTERVLLHATLCHAQKSIQHSLYLRRNKQQQHHDEDRSNDIGRRTGRRTSVWKWPDSARSKQTCTTRHFVLIVVGGGGVVVDGRVCVCVCAIYHLVV